MSKVPYSNAVGSLMYAMVSTRPDISHTVGTVSMTGPDPNTLPGYPGWSRLVEFHCTIPRECTKGPHLKEK